MRRGRALLAAILFFVAACERADEPKGSSQAQPEPEEGDLTTGYLGRIAYHYDPAVLTAATVTFAIPPGEEEVAYGDKLLPARGIAGSPELCPGGDSTCSVDVQPGLSMALLERPFAHYEQALRASDLADTIRPLELAGAEGIMLDLGHRDGLEETYRFVPVSSRTLLLRRQRNGASPAESEAIDQVIDSLDLGG